MATLWFRDSLKAWEKLNKAFLVWDRGYDFIHQSHALYVNDLVIGIHNPYLDPKFDFGTHFNYTKNKWKSLVSNYLDLHELALAKSKVGNLNKKKSNNYSIPLQFTNKHSNGKQCLLSLLFCKRVGNSKPSIVVFLRASEVTKRLICDLLLFQRIGEYVYSGEPFEVVIHINQMFQDDTVLLMYGAHKDISKTLKRSLLKAKDEVGAGLREKRAQYLYDRYRYFLSIKDLNEIKYKVHRRALKVLRPDLCKYPTTLAKDCKL